MKQASHSITIDTRGIGLVEVTRPVLDWLDRQRIGEGLLTIFCRHTSASLLIQENAAPAVKRDLARFFADLVREDAGYEHDDEGPDDMPAHIRSALTSVSLFIPVIGGEPALGTWQGIYLFEHRRAPHRRTLALHVIGA